MTKHANPGLFAAAPQAAVECLGMTFPSDDARRGYFLEKLREKLKDPEFRKIEGFPIGDDEDILTLSHPPYFTACPNPFVADFVARSGSPSSGKKHVGERTPFAVDVSEGKSDPVYSAHSYHTKVPYKAIIPAILHYTAPGELILDSFCGSGMTGVAAQLCDAPDLTLRAAVEEERRRSALEPAVWGRRNVVLTDLSPSATFIAANYNLPPDASVFEATITGVLKQLHDEMDWMYSTKHANSTTGYIDYTVWSEVFSCSQCLGEIAFFEVALDPDSQRVLDEFPCPHCSAALTKNRLDRIFEAISIRGTDRKSKRIKLKPVLIAYRTGRSRYEKKPDAADIQLLKKIESLPFPQSAPTYEFPIEAMYHGSRLGPKGFTHAHLLFLPRTLHVLGRFWELVSAIPDTQVRNAAKILAQHQFVNASVLNRYRPASSFGNAPLGGVYYVSSLIAEASVLALIEGSVKRVTRMFNAGVNSRTTGKGVLVSTASASNITGLPDSTVDYIFTDPPFGENIFYADLNLMSECWHGVFTEVGVEAIVDRVKGKELSDYQNMMRRCFKESFRVLKPGRWMTVVFHNSKNSVWNAIQEAILSAGFIVADVRTLDKQHGSFRQLTSSAVKQDLVISAYRPEADLERTARALSSAEGSAWEFLRHHLRHLPVFIKRQDSSEVIAERQCHLLYDRMVAFHVQRGYTVPLSFAEFHEGLQRRFPERDEMYFSPEQVMEYDRRRLEVNEVEQLELFVSNEKSAIQWVRRQLAESPQTYQTLQPQYMKEAQRVWEKHEEPLELSTILEQNFVKDPNNKWRVADPKRETDLEEIRNRALIKEFQQYLVAKGKLRVVRTEALRIGFKECWQKKDYVTIVQVAKRVPESVIEEDPALLMYLDNATLLKGE
jgi:16S rRNA G966 N2-methylase RsmD